MKLRDRDIVTSVFIILGALTVQFLILPYFIEMEESYDLASLSPAFFPKLATWIVTALAALLLCFTVFQRKKENKQDKGTLDNRELRRVYTAFAFVVVYIFAMKLMGFLVSTTLFLGALFFLQGIRKPFKIAAASLIVTFGVYFLFLYVMQVHFPKGLFFE